MKLPLLFASAVLIATGACRDAGSEPGGPPPELTALPRALTSAEQQVLGASNAFSFALWNRLNSAQPGENIFVSPLSASFALGMTLNGAANQTFDEMRTALQASSISQADINAGYRSLIDLLSGLDDAVTMQIANSVWYRNDFSFRQQFLDTVRTYFDAQATPLDFSNASAALSAINGWVNQKTSGNIPSIIDQIGANAVMYLINAIHFKAAWREQFEISKTTDATFHSVSGPQQARLMFRHGEMAYAETPSFQAVDLPYGNAAYSMTVLLPSDGNSVESLANSLATASWNTLTSSFTKRLVDLSLPRLHIEWERTLNDDLKALGMQIPFVGDAADFTGMSVAGNHLYISNVKQKAVVDINEEGTEAAAATSVEVGVTSAPLVTTVRIDRPYLIVLRERLSGTILFMGKVVRIPGAS